ncbi:11335_t:CDS:2, partial [Scutellospora calospora]
TKTLAPKPLSSETLVPETFSPAIRPLTNETLSPAIHPLTGFTTYHRKNSFGPIAVGSISPIIDTDVYRRSRQATTSITKGKRSKKKGQIWDKIIANIQTLKLQA